jgi:sec-independent protein translocase protein TatA
LAVSDRNGPGRSKDQWYNQKGFTSHNLLESHMFGSLGLPELLIILFIVVLIFGANRLPSLARGIGSSVKSFKEGMKDGESQ